MNCPPTIGTQRKQRKMGNICFDLIKKYGKLKNLGFQEIPYFASTQRLPPREGASQTREKVVVP